MSVRRLAGTTNYLTYPVGTQSVAAGWTYVMLVRRKASGERGLAAIKTSGGAFSAQFYLSLFKADNLQLQLNEATALTSPVLLAESEGWAVIAFSTTSAVESPTWRAHKWVQSTNTWKHEDGPTGINHIWASIAGGTMTVGNDGGDAADFDIAAEAFFNSKLTDAELEALVKLGSLEAWKEKSPAMLRLYNQASVTEEVKDLTGNGANQSARTGTTVVAEEPPIPYKAGQSVEVSPPAAVAKASAPSPTVTTTSSVTVEPPAAVATASAPAPTVTAEGEEEPTRRVVINREHPPSKIAVLVKAEDDTKLGRWAEDEASVENVLANATKTGDMPGGHGESGCSLARDPKQSYPDLGSFSKVEWQGVGGERLWTGTLRQQPQSDGERISIEPKAVGDKQFLEDDPTVIGPGFIDSDLSKWSDPSTQRKIDIKPPDGIYNPGSGTMSVGWQKAGEEPPSITMELQFQNGHPIVEAWYRGEGAPIGRLIYDFISAEELAGVHSIARIANDDVGSGFPATSVDHGSATAFTQEIDTPSYDPGADVLLSCAYEGAYEGEGTLTVRWRYVKVIGPQGLQLQGSYPNWGYFAKQMIPYIVAGSGLTTNPELLEDDEFIIPQAWFSDPTTRMAKLVEVTKYGLLDWFVFNDRILQYRKPGTYGRKWRLSPGSGAPKNSGPDAERILDRLMVGWQDVDGTAKTVGIPGSGAQFIDTRLQITDERNAAVAARRPKGKLLALNGVCELEPAIKVGIRFLEEAANLAQSGEATITGYCQDSFGIWWPAAYVQPGDWAADPGTQNYRKITSVNYAHDPKTASVSLGAPPEGLGALEARFNSRLIELGLG